MATEVVEKRSVSHVLGHDIYWSIFTADTVQLDQVLVLKFPEGNNRIFVKSNPIKRSLDSGSSHRSTHVITLASSMKSSSDIVPSFIIFTATSMEPRHFPLRTTPNCPEPSSSSKSSSAGSISHLSAYQGFKNIQIFKTFRLILLEVSFLNDYEP